MRRGAARGAMTISACGLVLLGGAWAADRTRGWETPRLDPPSFRVLRGGPADPSQEGWALVPLNPSCEACRRLAERRGEGSPGVVVLVVDQERAPSPALLEGLGDRRIWWDERGIWRRRWGHRVYGETLRFDASGRHLATVPPTTQSAGPR